jgi:hypothetical protein
MILLGVYDMSSGHIYNFYFKTWKTLSYLCAFSYEHTEMVLSHMFTKSAWDCLLPSMLQSCRQEMLWFLSCISFIISEIEHPSCVSLISPKVSTYIVVYFSMGEGRFFFFLLPCICFKIYKFKILIYYIGTWFLHK